MKLLKDKSNINPVSATYPYADIKDDTGIADGFSVNRENHADYFQFFERLFDKSGLTPTNLPDNATNGFQLYEAFLLLIGGDWTSTGITFPSGGGVTFANVGGTLFNVSGKYSLNDVALAGSATTASLPGPGTFTVCNLPAVMRPSKIVYPRAVVKKGSSEAIERIEIDTSGNVKISTAGAVGSTVQVWLDGVTFRKN